MQYDFDTVIDRRNTNSEKWNVEPGELPMWVADMDFAAAPEIIEAVMQKAAMGVLGYTHTPPEFAETVASWWYRRHGWEVDTEWVSFCIGVVPALSSLVRTFAKRGGNVLVQSPVYNMFFAAIANSGRKVVSNDLVYRKGKYSINWTDLEEKMSDPKTTLFFLCNPQNPTGQVWSREDLERMGKIAADNGVIVVSDEIHCDLTMPGVMYTPFASVNDVCAENSITLVSPTKAFNIPGLQTAAMVVPDPQLRGLAQAGLNRDELSEPNAFSIEASITAYTQCESWLTALRIYIRKNKEIFTQFLAFNLPDLTIVPSQATYLMWVDCSKIVSDTAAMCGFIREQTGLFITAGGVYGENGAGFVRINIACPATVLEDGLTRLARGIAAWKKIQGTTVEQERLV